MWRHWQSLDEKLFLWLRCASIWQLWVKNRQLFFYLIALAVVAYGYDLFSFSLKIDSENHAFSAGAKVQWLMQGRWGMYFLNAWLLPDAIMSFIPVLISVFGLSSGVWFFLLSLSDQRGLPDFLAAPLAIGCPVLAFAFYFTTLGYGLGIAIALTGIGTYLLTRWCGSGFLLSVCCFAIGIGVYQAVILLLPVLFGFYLLVRVIAGSELPLRWFVSRCIIFSVALLLAYLLFEAIKRYTLHLYSLDYAQDYLHSYVSFSADRNYLASIFSSFIAAQDYYTGSEKYYLYPLKVLSIVFGFSLTLSLCHILFARQLWRTKVFAVLLLLACLVAPMSLHFFSVGDIPPRIMLAIPFVFAGLVYLAALSSSKMLRLVLGMLVLGCFFNFAVINSRFALSNQLSWEADQDLSLLIIQRIHQIWQKLPDHPPPYPVEIVGEWPAVETPLYTHRDAIGASFYAWDGGSAERVTRLWSSMRQFDFREATPEERRSVVDRAMAMPSWPVAGSVDVVNGVIVIKIADYPQYRIDALCGSSGLLCRFRQPQ